MAVIVEVPDEHISRLARRLIGRRSGVRVVITSESNGSNGNGHVESDPPRKVSIRHERPNTASEMLDLLNEGVWAVLTSSEREIERRLRDCVDRVRAGSSPLLSDLAGDRGEVGAFFEVLQARGAARRQRSGERRDNPLSERETEILQRISEGWTSREIADEMGFQLQTVKNKVTTILTKTQARSRTQAVAKALTDGWIKAS